MACTNICLLLFLINESYGEALHIHIYALNGAPSVRSTTIISLLMFSRNLWQIVNRLYSMSCIKKLFQTKRGCSDRKPNVPRQLRSVACYQDGKVDVSILGDQRYLDNNEAVNLHITFVHRPMSTSKVNTTTSTPSTCICINSIHIHVPCK